MGVGGAAGRLAERCRKEYRGQRLLEEDLRMLSGQDRRDALYPKPAAAKA